MYWSRSIQTVDVHCAGEIGRIITGGVLDIPGQTIADKLAHINHTDDSLRRWLCSEPRSGPAGSFVLLLPTAQQQADVGFIVLQPDQAHAMSGSNAICAVTAILETGMQPMQEPETQVVLDTAAGLVTAMAHCRQGKVERVSLTMPVAFCSHQRQMISTGFGDIYFDICFGGVFYALVDVDQLGLTISSENARTLADIGVALREQIDSQLEIAHPLTPEVNGIAYVMFRDASIRGASYQGFIRTCTTMRPGRVDRSPCGTGSAALLAAMAARQEVGLGEKIITRSTIDSEFHCQITGETQVGNYPAIQVTVSGQAWIYAISQIGLDPSDPFPHGFVVADTWGNRGV